MEEEREGRREDEKQWEGRSRKEGRKRKILVVEENEERFKTRGGMTVRRGEGGGRGRRDRVRGLGGKGQEDETEGGGAGEPLLHGHSSLEPETFVLVAATADTYQTPLRDGSRYGCSESLPVPPKSCRSRVLSLSPGTWCGQVCSTNLQVCML